MDVAPENRQYLKSRQEPALEIRAAILEESQNNHLLEELGNNDESLDANEVEASPDEIESEKTDEFPEDSPNEPEAKEKETDADSEPDAGDDIQDLDFTDEFAILKEMEEDLREHYENEFDGEAKLGNTDAQDKRKFFFEATFSLMITSPSITSSNPATILNRVVFPIPEGPRIETISPFFNEKLKSLIIEPA